ncbi:MAG: methylated-DNA--[protein]-cysteine S-methyltransferase [Candidatus Eisenbacteria bacterium]|nr:methylated-DNA--[protein]-cysteine S-methyltransferase [Candidatus Eisenbacteria bacterium]
MAGRRRGESKKRSAGSKAAIVRQRDVDATSARVLTYATFPSDIGRILLVRSAKGLRLVRFGRDLDVDGELSRLPAGEKAVAVEDSLKLSRVADSIAAYLEGRRPRFDCALDLSGATEFTRQVLETVREIPCGSIRTYKWVAEKIGRPRATRPVGQALARNPLPIVIPCHRVVQSDGSLGGYSSGGTNMKRRLLAIETGQTGLALEPEPRATRRRIRFLLDSES